MVRCPALCVGVLLLSAGHLRYTKRCHPPGLPEKTGNSLRFVLKAAAVLAAVVLLSVTLTNMLSPESKPQNHPVRETAAVGSLGFADS
jgi:hypothetical protein